MAATTPVAVLRGHTDIAWHVAWSPEGATLASCGADRVVRLWRRNAGADDDSWRSAGELESIHDKTVRWVCWRADGKAMATASFDAQTCVYAAEGASMEVLAQLEGHDSEVKACAFSPSGAYLATCSRDKSIWIWEVDDESEFACAGVLHGHGGDVKSVAWHPREDVLVSCAYDDTLKIWLELDDDWFCADTLKGHGGTVWDAAFAPCGSRIVSCSSDATLRIWARRPVSGAEASEAAGLGPGAAAWRFDCLAVLSGWHAREIYSVDWRGAYIACCGADDAICIVEERANEAACMAGDSADAAAGDGGGAAAYSYALVARLLHAHDGDANCVRWNPARPTELASCGDDRTVRLWAFAPDAKS